MILHQKVHKALLFFIVLSMIIPPISVGNAKAYSDHPNLFVSAENTVFDNHFSGPMVVEVIVKTDNHQLDQAQGEPDVNVNGRHLRMVQSTDGNWYAFFANTDAAKQADQLAISSAGDSLDFGAFCSGSTPSTVLGADFSQTDGVAIPNSAIVSGTTQGTASFNSCSGTPVSASDQNNVVRYVPSLNTNSNVQPGQIGINQNVWPIVQLFSLSNDVQVEYNGLGGTQSVSLTYFDMPNISLQLDRTAYPLGSDVFATINDAELNIDPTSPDSWTFNVDSPQATFYQAFAEAGHSASGSGFVNLIPYLSSLGFKDNGKLQMNIGDVVKLKTNSLQTSTSVTANSITYGKLVTFVETGPNTGIFQSSMSSVSTIGVLSNAPRSHTGSIEYNLQSASIVSGTATADLSIGTNQGQFNPGQKQTITLTDNDQNLNAGLIDELDVFKSNTKVPALKIGNPVTLGSASDVNFYVNSIGFSSPISVSSSTPDSHSARLMIDTRSTAATSFAKITLNLGVSSQTLKDLFIDTSQSNSKGTNWVNYDLRSFQKQLGIVSLSGASMTLYFGSLSGTSVPIVSSGSITSGNGIVQISDSNIASIEAVSSGLPVFLEINFGTSGNIANENDQQPIVFDLFSFGSKNNQQVNNAIYRAELQETSSNSGTFTGTIEYAIINQLNQFDPNLIKSLRTFGSNIKFLANTQLTDNRGLDFSILSSEGGQQTTVTSKNDVQTHTGVVTLDSSSYRLGQPVTITVIDPDLSTDADTIQTYTAVNDPGSTSDDTVGDSSGNILLEVWIKGFRYHHCTINGVTYNGLTGTGFTLTETAPGSGVFSGVFKMPSKICSEDGTSLISPIGGSVQAWYHDFRDDSGRSIIISSKVYAPTTNPTPVQQTPAINPNPVASKILKMTQINDDNGHPISQSPHVGQKLNFKTLLTNANGDSQSLSYIVQVKDNQNKVVFLKWIDDNILPSSTNNELIAWTPTTPGIYHVEIYLWNGMTTLVPLSEKQSYLLQVGS